MKRQGLSLRKYLFYGLTLVLASVFIFLAIRGRRVEKERMRQGSEIVQNYTPSPTRILSPVDLEILTASMVREQGNTTAALPGTILHRIEIQNKGRVPYGEIQIRLNYIDSGGTVVLSRFHNIIERIGPGNTLRLTGIREDNIPDEVNDCLLKIVYADIEPGE